MSTTHTVKKRISQKNKTPRRNKNKKRYTSKGVGGKVDPHQSTRLGGGVTLYSPVVDVSKPLPK